MKTNAKWNGRAVETELFENPEYQNDSKVPWQKYRK